MKKYKLIKTYPGSPELGTTITIKKGTNMYFYNGLQIESSNNYPEFWKEIKEKEYEILSFMIDYGLTTLRPNGYYVKEGLNYSDCLNNKGATLEYMLNKEGWDGFNGPHIHSIKRLSDGEIFTIGDRVALNKTWEESYCLIKEIKINKEDNVLFTISEKDSEGTYNRFNNFYKINNITDVLSYNDVLNLYKKMKLDLDILDESKFIRLLSKLVNEKI